jgi:outer membrane protein
MKIIPKFITTVCALMLLVTANSALAQNKIATVNLSKLFDDYWKTKQAKAAFEDQKADLEKEGKGMLAEFNKGETEYKALLAAANDQAISDSEREKKKKEAEEKLRTLKDQQEALVKFQNQARVTLDERARRMRDNILAEVRKTVESKARSGSYSLVIDVAAETPNATPVILFTNGENDITDAILAQLNASAPPEAVKATEDKPASKK